jgi:imidazolonepropionase-like amidohydrolase
VKRLVPLLLLAAAAPVAHCQTTAIVGGKVVIGDGSPIIENGTVLIRDGRIVAAGDGVDVPANSIIVNARGKWVSPGIVAGFTDLGLTDVRLVKDSNDVSANGSPFSAALDVAPAINPRSEPIAVTRTSGVTTAFVTPLTSSAIFAGFGAVIDLSSRPDSVLKQHAFEYVEFGETGASRAGGSRTATFAAFRNALLEARRYTRDPAAYHGDQRGSLVNGFDASALAEVENGHVPLLVHVERASDILAVLSLRKDFPSLKLVLKGVSEGWLVAAQIAATQTPVLASALVDVPEHFEQLAATESNVGRLIDAGVHTALVTDEETVQEIRLLRQYAGNLVALTRVPGATGVNWAAAFALITSRPAESVGMGSEVGSLRAGRRADVVLWNGDPLELSTTATSVYIAGVEQPLINRQTLLRDRYIDLSPGPLPKAYVRD